METLKRKNVLIVCYGFPPNPGVAGRRWAKFAKYLKREGYGVSVVASENVHATTSDWLKDIEGISVEYLPVKYPKVFMKKANTFSDKLKYRFWLFLLQLIYRGNYYDRAIFWKCQIQRVLSRKIKQEKIDTVIVTSGPFILSYYVMRLKQKFPEISFICDYRDLWTEDKEITSFSRLNAKRVSSEKYYERKTILLADAVLTVADTMSEYFNNLCVNKPVYTLPNGFDLDDFRQVPDFEKDDKIRLVFTGTLYINLSYIIEPFFKEVSNICRNDAELRERLRVEFYGTFPDEYKNLINKYAIHENVKVYGRVSLSETYTRIKSADLCLLFLNDTYRFAMSTKFCEYISQNKKIIVCANEGPTADFINRHQLGFNITPDNCSERLLNIINCYRHGAPGNDNEAEGMDIIEQFSLPVLTRQLCDIINNTVPEGVNDFGTKHVLLTFDYELFLGTNSGSVEQCMLRPTEYLLAILDRHQLKSAIFFVDTTYLYQMEKYLAIDAVSKDYERIVSQLVEILKRGHSIFPHLHPHWLDAVYQKETNTWRLEQYNRYRYSVLNEDIKEELFDYSFRFIKKVQSMAQVDQPIDGYRAGGLCIQPFSSFKRQFEKYGIRNEFSVLNGYKNDNVNFYFNFEDTPLRPIYRFSEMVDREEKSGIFREFRISTVQLKNYFVFISRVFVKFVIPKEHKQTFGDGFSVIKSEENFISRYGLNISFFAEAKEVVSMDYLTRYKALMCTKQLKEANYIHFLSHPKVFSKYGLDSFEMFISKAKARYKLNTDFRKMF
ncbi:MAG: glycosyltransferase [Sediminibacterium sp.]|nr:glycosyltransferase [Sediminibacterium sp.]